MNEAVDVVVVGAGVVGLAVARALALHGFEVLVLEQHDLIGSEISSRNSEVIHAGIYYPTGSLKARLCVRGKALLYAYCAQRHVAHRRCGKLIVAVNDDQVEQLQGYKAQAAANAVTDLEWVSASELKRLEPAVAGHRALWSPSTGIIDSHGYMLALQGDLEAAGGTVVFNTRVDALCQRQGGLEIRTADMALPARWVVNCAGLHAVGLAAGVTEQVPVAHYAIGHYYTYSGRAPFTHLVYPVAEPGGLGVHVTLDQAGAVKFGPDVRWIETPDYTFDDSARAQFLAAIAAYFPAIEPERLQPGYTGIRPKISGPGEAAADFRIDGPDVHGVPGLVNLLGIESPGLTASLAIAEQVASMVCGGSHA